MTLYGNFSKQFQVKVYQLDGTFKHTLPANKRTSAISYTENINGSQGELTITLNTTFDDTDIINGDVIEVYVFNETYKNGKLIYVGIIKRIKRAYVSNLEQITYTALPLSFLLNKILFTSGGNKVFNKNQDPAQTIKDVIDYFNTQYTQSFFSYAGGKIDNYGSSISLDFSYNSCFESIKTVKDTTDFWWFIDASGEVYFKAFPGTATHKLTLQKHVESIDLDEKAEDIVNDYFLEWASGINNNSDATSITNNGRLQLYKSETNIADTGSADETITNFLSENKDTKTIINSLVVNSNYNIESIHPGDTLTILNISGYTIANVQVNKISYTGDNLSIEVGDFESLAKTITSL